MAPAESTGPDWKPGSDVYPPWALCRSRSSSGLLTYLSEMSIFVHFFGGVHNIFHTGPETRGAGIRGPPTNRQKFLATYTIMMALSGTHALLSMEVLLTDQSVPLIHAPENLARTQKHLSLFFSSEPRGGTFCFLSFLFVGFSHRPMAFGPCEGVPFHSRCK